MFCYFHLVKSQIIAKNTACHLLRLRVKISTLWNPRNFLMNVLLNLKTVKFYFIAKALVYCPTEGIATVKSFMIQAPGLCKLIKTAKNVPFHWILGEIVNLKKNQLEHKISNDLKVLVDILVS
jgi:hypothetical protein